jgi:hypothetical protein
MSFTTNISILYLITKRRMDTTCKREIEIMRALGFRIPSDEFETYEQIYARVLENPSRYSDIKFEEGDDAHKKTKKYKQYLRVHMFLVAHEQPKILEFLVEANPGILLKTVIEIDDKLLRGRGRLLSLMKQDKSSSTLSKDEKKKRYCFRRSSHCSASKYSTYLKLCWLLSSSATSTTVLHDADETATTTKKVENKGGPSVPQKKYAEMMMMVQTKQEDNKMMAGAMISMTKALKLLDVLCRLMAACAADEEEKVDTLFICEDLSWSKVLKQSYAAKALPMLDELLEKMGGNMAAAKREIAGMVKKLRANVKLIFGNKERTDDERTTAKIAFNLIREQIRKKMRKC